MNFSLRKPPSSQGLIRLGCYLLVFLPAALGFLYVYWFGVNVVYGDSISMASRFNKLSSGTLGVSDLFKLHNAHWVVFPQSIMLALGTLTRWNSVAEMYFSQICMLGTFVFLLLPFKSSIKVRSAFFPLLLIPISLLVFSFSQYDSMLKGYQITFTFAVMSGVIALYLLYVLGRTNRTVLVFSAALASAAVAAFSVGAGLTVWIAGLLQLFITPMERRLKWIFIAVWGSATAGVWVAYLIARAGQDRETESSLAMLTQPLAATDFFLRLLGSALFDNWLAFEAGLFLALLALVALIVAYKDERGLSHYSFWISLLFWSFLILATVVAGRFSLGLGLSAAPRYIPFAVLAVVAVYGLLATATFGRGLSIKRPSIGALLLVVLVGTVLVSAAGSYPKGMQMGRMEKESREEAASVLAAYDSRSDGDLEDAFQKPGDRVRKVAQVADKLGYNVFSESP